MSAQSLRNKAVESLEVARDVFIVGSLTGDSLIRFAYGGCVQTAGRLIRAYSGDDRTNDKTSGKNRVSSNSSPTSSFREKKQPLAVMNGIEGHHIYPRQEAGQSGSFENGSRSFMAVHLGTWWSSFMRLWGN